MKPAPKDQYVQWSDELFHAAVTHVEDIGPLGLYGHDSSIGLDIYDRLRNNSNLTPGMLSENIGYGSSHPIESIVLSILLYSE